MLKLCCSLLVSSCIAHVKHCFVILTCSCFVLVCYTLWSFCFCCNKCFVQKKNVQVIQCIMLVQSPFVHILAGCLCITISISRVMVYLQCGSWQKWMSAAISITSLKDDGRQIQTTSTVLLSQDVHQLLHSSPLGVMYQNLWCYSKFIFTFNAQKLRISFEKSFFNYKFMFFLFL